MATIDDKVVAISFESSKFEQGVNRTISSLEKLKSHLSGMHAGKNFDDLNAAAKRVDMGHISDGVQKISKALDALRLMAIGVMTQIAAKAVFAGTAFVKAFTLDPVKAGFKEYSTNLNAVQTILANTQSAGVGLKEVNATLKELNEYSDKTIYNFGQMARNIGTFTAAGVDLKTSTQSIKGISNLAALSGSNAEQASTAMYQLSQALAAGKVDLRDWNSVVNAGMGGSVFQRALAQTAEAMGTIKKGAVELEGPMKNVKINGQSFRAALSDPKMKGWLTSGVLTNTLKQFTADLKDSELAAMGFTAAQIKSIQQTAKTAMHAATEVKTIQQVFDVAKETAGSGWAETFQIVFGTFEEAKKTFTALSETVNGFINTNADARNKVLADWKALGGRTVLIDGIKTAFKNLGLIIAPIKEAFRDIFPATTGKGLFELTQGFARFADALKPSITTIDGLKRTFAGVFAIFSIIGQVIGGVVTVFGKLFGVLGDGTGGFLQFTGSIGDFLVKVDAALKKGDRFHNFFAKLGDVLAVPIKLLQDLAGAIGDLFQGLSRGGGGFSGEMDAMSKVTAAFSGILEKLGEIAPRVLENVKEIASALKPAFDAYMEIMQGFGRAIGEAAANMNFEAILSVIRVGLLGGIVLLLKNFFGKGSIVTQIMGGFQGLGGGIIGSIAGSFNALQGSMVAMQQNIKAKTLKEIAIAIALLTASVVALSFVDAEGLKKAITAIGFMMGELLIAMGIMDKIATGAGFLKLPIIAAGMIALAAAIDILAIAVFALSRLSWEELLKGLGGVGALLGGLVAATIPLAANSAGMIRAGIGLTAIAIALNIMALAVRQMGSLDMGALAKGLGGVAVALGTLVAATNRIPKGGMIGIGIGLMAVAAALLIMSQAVESFGSMDLMTMGKGLAGVGASLVIIGLAMKLMPKSMILTGAGLVIVAAGLNLIAKAVASMGEMSMSEIAKGLGVLAGSLIILGVAMSAMSGMIVGAAALTITAAGISLLAGALAKMGAMSWGEILKSLITLAGALTLIGIAGALITPAIPSLLGFGAALLLIGAGLALAGAGIFLIATGLSALVVAAPTGVGVIVAAFVTLQEGIIKNAKLLILGLLEIVKSFAAVAPQFVDAIVKILNSLIDAIILMLPKIAELFNVLITTIIQVLDTNQDRIIQAGFDLVLALLQGIKNNIGPLITLILDIIVKILNTISANLSRIVTAGLNLLLAFIKGIAGGYTQVVTAVLEIITRFLNGIATNLGRIVTAGLSILTSVLRGIANGIGKVVTAGADIIIALVEGIGQELERVVKAARKAAKSFMMTLAEEIPKFAQDVFTALITLINNMATVIENNSGPLRDAGLRLGWAIINGMTAGILGKAKDVYDAAGGVVEKALGIMNKIGGILSPSKETMKIGKFLMDGLFLGIQGNARAAVGAAEEVSWAVIDKFKDTFQTKSPSRVMIEIGKYVGEGFAQGLRESQASINEVWKELDAKLLEAASSAREIITEEQKKLKELRAADKQDAEAIKAAQKTIAENELILKQSVAGHQALTKELKDEKAALSALVGQYNTLGEQLTAAREKLKAAKEERAQTIEGYTEKYSEMPAITSGEGTGQEQLAAYLKALQDQTASVATYSATLDELRKLGLNKGTYEKLVEEGTADQAFATALLAGGKTAVEGLNKLDVQLDKEAKKLGTRAGGYLKNSGVEAAQGLVDGLDSKMDSIRRKAEEMAEIINKAFKNAMKQKSPSRVMYENGVNVVQGLANGIAASAHLVTSAVDTAASAAIDAMKSSVQKIADVVTSELNTDPVITPVLDLTTIRAQAGELSALTNVTPITAATSYGQASLISAEQLAAQSEEVAAAGLGGTSVKFEQNNYSPESLTEIEIYRQTKNQLSQLKSALSLT